MCVGFFVVLVCGNVVFGEVMYFLCVDLYFECMVVVVDYDCM